ncbi:Hypp9491 [Branchiostoma lanceolatum]|uniref:Hypp9491 protein n=1 Tax=Branchiostoma lanceolatum TaxID=7740 RepID=A0A8S4MMN4_BRALA|nr:Hypp9491 [Branchiostoma lanceolatum]
MWNVYNRNTDTRTNNHVEGFHQRWNNTIGRAHPPLWFFLQRMKDEQKTVEQTLASVARGDPPPPRRRKWRELERRITRLRQEYVDGRRSLDRCWCAVVHAIKTFV